MNSLGLASMMVSALAAIGFAAWFSVVKYRLLQEMGQIKKSESEMVALRTRLEALENQPDPTVEQYDALLMKISELRAECKDNARDIEAAEGNFIRYVNKDNARQRRADKPGASAEPEKEPVTPKRSLSDLVASGEAVPLAPSEPVATNNNFGRLARR